MITALALDGALGDVAYLLITAAFFGLAVLLLGACRRIAGDAAVPDDASRGMVDHDPDDAGRQAPAAAPAGSPEVTA